jgi:hypothetical protein
MGSGYWRAKMKTLAIACLLALTAGPAAAGGFHLVLMLDSVGGRPLEIVPQPYPSLAACEAAGRVWARPNRSYFTWRCIQAP